MRELNFDSGIVEYRVNGKATLSFNRSDPNLYNRMQELNGKLAAIDSDLKKEKDAAEDGNAVKHAQNGKVFFMRNIRFKEQQQCHTGVGTQAGQQRGKG